MPRIRRASGQTIRLLSSLTEAPKQWRHGYELSQATELMSGTLYPILMRLSERGLLEHKWVPSEENGRPRHVYRLTSKGLAYANDQLALCAELGLTAAYGIRNS